MGKWVLRFVGCLLAFCLVLGSTGCKTKGKQAADLRGRLSEELAFSLLAERRGESFTATVWLGEGETMERDMTVVFSSPLSVKGLTVSQKNGQITAVFGTLTVKEDAVRQILLLLSPFCLYNIKESVVYREGKDRVLCYAGEGESITYYLQKEDFPYKIVYALPEESIVLYPTLTS